MPTNEKMDVRHATRDDCAHLAVLADMATRRLYSFVWATAAEPGESAVSIGRDIILSSSDHPIHQANWRIGELDGQVTGACNSHVMSMDKSAASIGGEISTVLKPLNELKEIANGTWYVAAIATYPEFRARGVGRTLLQSAETMARNAGNERLTLMVGSFNHSAQRLYRLYGFQEWERRQFVPFSGSDKEGEWILMYKNL